MTPKSLAYAAPIPLVALVAYLVARDGLRPPQNQCVAVELVGADENDAGIRVPEQTLWEVCNLGGEDAGLDVLLRRVCAGPAADECGVRGVPVDERTVEQRRCVQAALARCYEQAPGTGGVVWMSAPYPADGQTAEVRRMTRAQFRAKGCACWNQRDAGVCREYIPGADAGPFVRLAPTGTTLQPGTWVGPGCAPTPCVETEVREARGPQMAPECR